MMAGACGDKDATTSPIACAGVPTGRWGVAGACRAVGCGKAVVARQGQAGRWWRSRPVPRDGVTSGDTCCLSVRSAIFANSTGVLLRFQCEIVPNKQKL